MNKVLLSLILSSSILLSNVINGIALTVNDDPITLYDIQETMDKHNIHKNKAVGLLVDKILYEQLIEKFNITADIFDVNNYIDQLAKTNGMDTYDFKSIIKQKYSDYSIFEEEAKKIVIRQKLIKEIIKGQLKIATEEDMKIYYEKNLKDFTTSEIIDTIQYTSKNKASLINTIKSPLLVQEGVEKNSISFNIQEVNPQTQYLLTNTKVNEFTPIFVSNKFYTTLFISKKEGTSTLKYEHVKNKIFSEIMDSREKKYLKEYFEKQKLTADIKIVR